MHLNCFNLINGRFDVAAVDVGNWSKKGLVFAAGARFNHGVGPGPGNEFAQGIAAVGHAGHRLRTPEGSPVPLTAAVAQEAAGIVAVIDQIVADAPARVQAVEHRTAVLLRRFRV